jgi:DNA ligase (NAD+)
MTKEQALQEIESLTGQIHTYNQLYYVENKSEISDYDFDQLLKRLEALEASFPEFAFDNSPTKRVGGYLTKKFESVVHRFPMLSLSNTYS